MTSRKIVRSMAMGTALAFASTSALVSTPAHAQFGGIVYDPSNYAQNVLTAARTLEQINNQIRMLQNQATSLINEAKNLQSLPLTIVQPLQDQIRQTQQLLNEAQRIAYDVRTIEGAFDQHYKNVPLGASQRTMVDGAEATSVCCIAPTPPRRQPTSRFCKLHERPQTNHERDESNKQRQDAAAELEEDS